MIHYVCTGDCRGESPELKSCGATTCPMHDKPLTPCECEDGKHEGVMPASQ